MTCPPSGRCDNRVHARKVYWQVGLFPKIVFGFQTLNDNTNALANGIILMTMSSFFNYFYTSFKLGAQKIATLVNCTYSISNFSLLGTFARIFLVFSVLLSGAFRRARIFKLLCCVRWHAARRMPHSFIIHLFQLNVKLCRAIFVVGCVCVLLDEPMPTAIKQWVEYHALYHSVQKLIRLQPSFEALKHNVVGSPAPE